ncbi:hypothetical protein, partial [Pseudonocardia sp. ICBG162]|uniref:hypothetical protein n=1 Tax=Pseudonocardia sp. ICBG162 TaxID=2846761 RepID=UPI001CF6F23B
MQALTHGDARTRPGPGVTGGCGVPSEAQAVGVVHLGGALGGGLVLGRGGEPARLLLGLATTVLPLGGRGLGVPTPLPGRPATTCSFASLRAFFSAFAAASRLATFSSRAALAFLAAFFSAAAA